MNRSLNRTILLILLFVYLCPAIMQGRQKEVLETVIYLSGGKKTIYSHLNSISEASKYMFVYDSDLVQNDKQIKIYAGTRTIKEAIYEVLKNNTLNLIIEGNHILICKSDIYAKKAADMPIPNYKILEGVLIDEKSGEPVDFCSMGIENSSISTISNLNGEFKLKIPDSLSSKLLSIERIGYRRKKIPISLLFNQHAVITLNPEIYELKEVVVKYTSPHNMLKNMIKNRVTNYSDKPIYLTTFYREGVEYKKKLNSLTEAVFKIYKSPINDKSGNDHVKLLKKSIIENKDKKDTLAAKIIAGINACLALDIMKNLPDFLDIDRYFNSYKYSFGTPIFMDSNLINVINFKPQIENKEPIYKGTLYIDNISKALISATIELDPDHIERATGLFVAKQGTSIKIMPDKVIYTVSYKLLNNKYYINHIRGDLYFKVKRRHQLFGNSLLHTWFEMVTCKITVQNVTKFSKTERISTHSVFSDDLHPNNGADFWGELNIIPWEQELNKNINEISKKIERIVMEE